MALGTCRGERGLWLGRGHVLGKLWGRRGRPDLAGGEPGEKVASRPISFSHSHRRPATWKSCGPFRTSATPNCANTRAPFCSVSAFGLLSVSQSRRKPCPGFQGFASATDVFSCLLPTPNRILIGPETLPRAWLRETGLTWGLGHQTHHPAISSRVLSGRRTPVGW